MTAAPVIAPINVRAFGSARRTGWERSVLPLTALGLIAAVVRFMSFQATRSEFTEELVPRAVAQSQLYYFAHAAQIALLITAGVIALLCIDSRMIQRGYRLRFAMFIGAALLMTFRGYTLSDLLSTKLADSTGPLPCFISVLLFVGARRSNWNFLGKSMVILALVLSAMVLMGMAGLRTFTRAEGGAYLTGALNSLYWPASWIALRDYPRNSFARRLRFAPIAIFALGSFFTQTRLNFIMLFVLLAVYGYLQYRRRSPQAATWLVGLALAVWLTLFTAIFLRDTRVFDKLETVGEAFYSRLADDTRTGQFIWFAQVHEPRGEKFFGAICIVNAAADEQLCDDGRNAGSMLEMNDSRRVMQLNAPAFAHGILPGVHG